jgi:hypothetical protein
MHLKQIHQQQKLVYTISVESYGVLTLSVHNEKINCLRMGLIIGIWPTHKQNLSTLSRQCSSIGTAYQQHHHPTISLLSKQCTSSYNISDKLLHVSTPKCHHQGIITTEVQKPTCQHMLYTYDLCYNNSSVSKHVV